MNTMKSNNHNDEIKDASIGEEAIKSWDKKGLLPSLAPQITHVLSRHIDLNKGEDIKDIESMFRGIKDNDDSAYESFNEFTKTLLVNEHYQRNLDELTRATYPTTTNK